MTADDEAPAAPPPQANDSQAVKSAAIVIIIVMSITALKVGRAVVLPVIISVLLSLLLSTPVRWLRKKRIPERFGAAIVVFGALGLAFGAGALLFTPAVAWVTSAPATIESVATKVRLIAKPMVALQQSADRMATVTAPAAQPGVKPLAKVELQGPGLFERFGLSAIEAVPTALSVIFLTYFLLASGPLFRKKLAQVLPGRRDVVHFETILSEIEIVTSKFLATATMINTGVGVALALALWAAGVPNPILWGGVAAVLNFVPYIGPISIAMIVTFASLASFDDPRRALVAPACFVAIHLVENNLITPLLLGRRLPVNTVAIFLGLLFFAWIWGIPGAVLAVPLTTVVKVACDHIPALNHFGELLGN
jgi:predicted PurR-regulated permease PerM